MNDFVPPELYGVIGYPLAQSLSPLLHTTAFRRLGLPGVLIPWPMRQEKLPEFIAAVRLLGIRGCCVTMPHKEAIIPLLDEVTERVRGIGAVNTLYRDGDKVCGENTDILGFMEPLLAEKLPGDTPVLLLGAGGSAKAAVAGLQSLGLGNIWVASRRPEQSSELAERFNLKTVTWERRGKVEAGLIVNTTALGMRGKFEDETGYDREWFAGKTPGIAYDIVYTPFQTRLLREAVAEGWRAIGGLEMFLGQADHQCRIWTGGLRLPQEARQAVIDALS